MKCRLFDFLYNLDRAAASLFGAPAQETISSEVGRYANSNWAARLLRNLLDAIQKNHCETAMKHADALDAVDDGMEK